MPFPSGLRTTPLTYMKRVFEVMDLDGLAAIIHRWQRIALTAAYDRYDEAAERADLLDYCEGLQRLMEAAHILQREMEWDTEGRVKRQLSEEIKYDLLTEEHSFRLNEEEMNNLQTVVDNFFAVFAPPYARRELWDMLACVVECTQERIKKLDLLFEYECLYAILEAAWLFLNQPRKKEQSNEENQTEGL